MYLKITQVVGGVMKLYGAVKAVGNVIDNLVGKTRSGPSPRRSARHASVRD